MPDPKRFLEFVSRLPPLPTSLMATAVPPGADPRHWHRPDDDRIFVFGSNLMGIHGGGAAWYAHNILNAEWGVGEGLTGKAYALPTCFEPGLPVDFDTLMDAVEDFLDFARSRPDLRFFVSDIGCGIAGFYVCEVQPLFLGAPDNCDLPVGWREDTAICLCPTHAPTGGP